MDKGIEIVDGIGEAINLSVSVAAMVLLPRAFVYSDLREAISIEKRYLTSDLSSRS